MSGIPEEIADYGDTKTKPRQNPEFKPGAGFGTEDYYVWSRCDGASSVHDIILMVGLGTSRSIEILAKLRDIGAVLLPGESRPPPLIHQRLIAAQTAPPKAAAATPAPSTPAPSTDKVSGRGASASSGAKNARAQPAESSDSSPKEATPAKPLLTLPKPSKEESDAMSLDLAMEEQDRIRILLFRRRLTGSNLFELLEVEADTDKRNIKRAYFRLSKEFHPDLHYGKDIGPFEGWLAEVFKAITNAFKTLGNNKKRAKYEATLRGGVGADLPQSKEDHAEALFLNACDSELHGDSDHALKLFAAAIRMDEKPKYMRRAAMCAVQARELSVAEEYAKKAAHLCEKDASYQRVLADVYRAGSQLDKAKQILEMALNLYIENDTLNGELQSDLASVDAEIAEKLANETS